MTRNDPMTNDDIPFPEKDSWWSPGRPAPLHIDLVPRHHDDGTMTYRPVIMEQRAWIRDPQCPGPRLIDFVRPKKDDDKS